MYHIHSVGIKVQLDTGCLHNTYIRKVYLTSSLSTSYRKCELENLFITVSNSVPYGLKCVYMGDLFYTLCATVFPLWALCP